MCNKILLIGPPSKDRRRLEESFNEKAASLDVHLQLVIIDGVDSIVDLGIERVPAIIINNDFDHPITLASSDTEITDKLDYIRQRKGCTCNKSCQRNKKKQAQADKLLEPS